MRLKDLEERIADYRSVYGDDVDPVIDVAMQPSRPLRAGVKGVVTQDDMDLTQDDIDPGSPGVNTPPSGVKPSFWIVISDPDSYEVPLGREMWSSAY